MASVNHTRELASLLSDENIFFLSADDKARLLLGLPVSRKQTVMLMYLECRVKLPDHDFWIGEKHKLISSLRAACEKKREGLLTTRADIAIWSGKHEKSSAASHIVDFWAILSVDEFKVACLKDGVLKPMLFISIDGGPEEAPKSTMTLVGHETNLEILKFILKSIERFTF